jgi:hypothetical protein
MGISVSAPSLPQLRSNRNVRIIKGFLEGEEGFLAEYDANSVWVEVGYETYQLPRDHVASNLNQRELDYLAAKAAG